MKLFYLAISTLAFTGCATNVGMNGSTPLGGSSSLNLNQAGQAQGSVNIGGFNVSTSN
jgi:hypothetical protein